MMNEHVVRGLVNFLAIFILGYMVQKSDIFSTRERTVSLHAVGAVGLCIVAEVITMTFLSPTTIHRVLNSLFCVVGFGASPFVPLLIAKAFGNQEQDHSKVIYLPAAANLVLSLVSPFFGFIFQISAANQYSRGIMFLTYVTAYVFGIIVFLVRTLSTIHVYQNSNKIVLAGLVSLTLVGTSIQVFLPAIFSSWTTVTLVMILGYAYYSELLEKHDVMTNLFNRRAYEQHLPRLATKGSGVIILLDVDDFKQVNDNYGHQYGDICLQNVATHIRSSFGRIGLCYRVGGDEFSVLSSCTDLEVLQGVEDSFLKNMDLSRQRDSRIPWVSFGHAFFDSELQGAAEVVEEADRQLFSYKRQRKIETQSGAVSR